MGVRAAVANAAASVHAYVSSVHVDDSRVPYFELTLGFIVATYAWNTYLDLRQRQVHTPHLSTFALITLPRTPATRLTLYQGTCITSAAARRQ